MSDSGVRADTFVQTIFTIAKTSTFAIFREHHLAACKYHKGAASERQDEDEGAIWEMLKSEEDQLGAVPCPRMAVDVAKIAAT
jgi:hypothetical protein